MTRRSSSDGRWTTAVSVSRPRPTDRADGADPARARGQTRTPQARLAIRASRGSRVLDSYRRTVTAAERRGALRFAQQQAVDVQGNPAVRILHEVDEHGHAVPVPHGALPSMHSFRHTVASRALPAGSTSLRLSATTGRTKGLISIGALRHRGVGLRELNLAPGGLDRRNAVLVPLSAGHPRPRKDYAWGPPSGFGVSTQPNSMSDAARCPFTGVAGADADAIG